MRLPACLLILGLAVSTAAAADPELLSRHYHGASITDVWSEGSYVYAATGHGILVLDYSEPAAPTELAFYPLEGACQLTGLGGRLYVAAEWGGLAVFDLEAAGALAFVTQDPIGKVLDVEPGIQEEPNTVCVLADNVIKTVTLTGSTFQVEPTGHGGPDVPPLAWITTSPAGISATTERYFEPISSSHSDRMQYRKAFFWGEESQDDAEIGSINTYVDMIPLSAYGHDLAMGALGSDLSITQLESQAVDEVNLPGNYSRLHHMTLSTPQGGEVHKLIVAGRDDLWLYGQTSNVRVMNLDPELNMTAGTGLHLDSGEGRVGGMHSQRDGSLYVAYKEDGLRRLQVSTNGDAVEQSSLRKAGFEGQLAGNDKFLVRWWPDEEAQWYAHGDGGSLTELDFTGAGTSRVVMDDRVAVVRKGDLLELWDVSNAVPVLRDSLRLEGAKRTVLSQGRLAVQAGSATLLYHVSRSFEYRGEIENGLKFWISGTNLIAAWSGAVGHDGEYAVGTTRYDISDLENPRKIGRSNIFSGSRVEPVQSVNVLGNYLFALYYSFDMYERDHKQELAIFDFTDLSAPKRIDTLFDEAGVTGVRMQRVFDDHLAVTADGAEHNLLLYRVDGRGNLVCTDSLWSYGADRVAGSGRRTMYVAGRFGSVASYAYDPVYHLRGFRSDLRAGGVYLEWDVYNPSALVGVHRKVEGGDLELLAESVGMESYLDPDPVPGRQEYWVITEESGGYSQPYGPVWVQYAPPSVEAEPVTEGVRLTWAIQGSDVTGFAVQRMREGEWELLADNLPADVGEFIDTEVTDQGYEYRVVALLQGGGEKPLNAVSVDVPAQEVWSDIHPEGVLLRWRLRGSDVQSIDVTRSHGGTEVVLAAGLSPIRPSFEDRNPPAGSWEYSVYANLFDGSRFVVGSSLVEIEPRVTLSAGPTPFAESVTLRFEINQEQRCRIDVLDVQGRLVTTVVDAHLPPGEYAEPWAGTDGGGNRVAAGFYFLRLRTPDVLKVLRLVHLP